MSRALLFLVAAACGETGQQPITAAFHARGGATTIDVGAWHVELTTALVGFGPAYFCASASADLDRCPTAVIEVAHASAIDALAGDQDLGELDGVTGDVKSAMYDWGISWLLTHQAPEPDPGAPEGHSVQLAATATNGATTLAIAADVDVPTSDPGAPAVRQQRTSSTLTDDGATLTVVIDASRWLAAIDFDALAVQGSQITIAPGSSEYSAIVNGMVTAAPAVFEWDHQERQRQ